MHRLWGRRSAGLDMPERARSVCAVYYEAGIRATRPHEERPIDLLAALLSAQETEEKPCWLVNLTTRSLTN